MPNGRLENDVFTQMAGTGFVNNDPIGASVESTVFAFNGYDGIETNGHATSGGATDGFDVEDSIFNSNNYEQYGCGYACGIANMKYEHMDGGVVKNNVFENGQGGGKGFWADDGSSNIHVVNNLVHNNGGHGIFYEVSDTGIIASNLIYGNSGYGIKLGSADTQVYNNTIVNSGSGNLLVYDDPRTPKAGSGPNTANDVMVNNIFYSGSGQAMINAQNLESSGATTAAESYFTTINYNAYYRANNSPGTLFTWNTSSGNATYGSAALFRAATGFETNALDVTSGTDPFFTNQASGDYTVRGGSVVYHTSTTIPSDVANAMGLSTPTGQSRGAIKWYPNGN